MHELIESTGSFVAHSSRFLIEARRHGPSPNGFGAR